MKMILASLLYTYERIALTDMSEPCADVKRAVPLEKPLGIISRIRENVPHYKKLVYVANDPFDYSDNDEGVEVTTKSLSLAGLSFTKSVCLDERNAKNASSILDGASLIILRGGKCDIQLDFFKRINLAQILRISDALVIGVSAGAMNLCNIVANFPEELSDLPAPRFLNGLEFWDGIVIPHFDGESKQYQFPCEDFNIARDYILPMSKNREFTAISNDGYIVLDGKTVKLYGKAWKIRDGKVLPVPCEKE